LDGYTHQDFTETLGSYHEMITQTLNDLRSHGLIQIERKRLILIDKADLERVADS
jgi:hypothetical protein